MKTVRIAKPLMLGLSLAISAATSALSQQSDWSYSATIYLFTPETEVSLDTPAGTLDSTLSFSDALENLDLAVLAIDHRDLANGVDRQKADFAKLRA